jgi:hypothetical protein
MNELPRHALHHVSATIPAMRERATLPAGRGQLRSSTDAQLDIQLLLPTEAWIDEANSS